jgi:hypothetical protein
LTNAKKEKTPNSVKNASRNPALIPKQVSNLRGSLTSAFAPLHIRSKKNQAQGEGCS